MLRYLVRFSLPLGILPQLRSLLQGTPYLLCQLVAQLTIVDRSKDGIVHVWDLGSSLPTTDSAEPIKLAYFAREDAGDLTSLDWNFDGSLLAIGSYDSILRICTPSGELYFSHRQHEVRDLLHLVTALIRLFSVRRDLYLQPSFRNLVSGLLVRV